VYLDNQLHAPFYNEYGAVNGAPGAGVSWQIDEPGFGDANRTGTIFANVEANTLDNTNHVPGTASNFFGDCGANGGGSVNPGCNNDVSLALGFNFILAADEFATITVTATPTLPASGFYLRQADPDTPSNLYLTGTISIRPGGPRPPGIPEPESWLLVGAGALLGIGGLRRKQGKAVRGGATNVLAAIAVLAALALPCMAVAPAVKVVPWIPSTPTIPHETYAGKSIALKGTTDVQGPTIQATWDFGDGSPTAVFTVTDRYAVEATHVYSGPVNATWTAKLTVRNTTTGESTTMNYPVIMKAAGVAPDCLPEAGACHEVNVAIDEGLWYLHKTMRRTTVGMTDFGDWLNLSGAYGATATNIQAFEVNGHLESGAASNPYTEDVQRALRSVLSWLTTGTVANRSIPVAAPPSCTTPPCTLNPDGNGNGYAVYVNQGNPFYQGGMLMDAIVASGTPNKVATTGPAPSGADPGILGRTYRSIVQDMADGYLNCMYFGSQGGGWRYGCGAFPDNSACQWAAIGIIGAARSFGVVMPPLARDWNKVWLNYSQNMSTGVFGYTDPNPVWGPFATTPSGMVQLAMDGIGRGNAQWDKAETFMRDNFANAPTGYPNSLKSYYYGMFSFTKAMLLHAPGGVLTPIRFLQSKTAGVPPIDWYAADTRKGDPTDGVARFLVTQQGTPGNWDNIQAPSGDQRPFSTGFAIIMLRRSSGIGGCVSDLQGRGTAGGRAPARIDLTWHGITGADHYDVLRGAASGGPYAPVGSSSTLVFSDSTGLTSGSTYYYVLQPRPVSGAAICQSNEARVTIPAAR
jgi:hypothetical protein